MDIHPHHQSHLRIAAVAVAVALTAVFHFTVAVNPQGPTRAMMIVAIAAAAHILLVVAGRKPNMWAYLFLAPVLVAAAASVLFSTETVFFIGSLIMILCTALFVYWVSVPAVSFWKASVLTPAQFFFDSVLPFTGFNELWGKLRAGKRWSSVAVGVVIALPLLLLCAALFASADLLFSKALEQVLNIERLPEYAGKTIRDALFGLYFAGAAWVFLVKRKPAEQLKAVDAGTPDRAIFGTVLGLLNALFAVFLFFQAVYFFGGQKVIEQYGVTYADYARQGFFQLLGVAGVVFLLSLAMYYGTEMKDKLLRGLTIGLIAQTAVVIASAASRLLLYIDAYGYSVSRVWALSFVFLIAGVLLALALAALSHVRFSHLERVLSVGMLAFFSLMLVVNVEGFVAEKNVDRFLSGKTRRMDINYLLDLNAAAVPALTRLAQQTWPTEEGVLLQGCPNRWIAGKTDCEAYGNLSRREALRNMLKSQQADIQDRVKSWRTATLSDYRALAALAQIIK